jgi:hypothetical protein
MLLIRSLNEEFPESDFSAESVFEENASSSPSDEKFLSALTCC